MTSEYVQAIGEAIALTALIMCVCLPFMLIVADVLISRRWRREDARLMRASAKAATRVKLTVVKGGKGEEK